MDVVRPTAGLPVDRLLLDTRGAAPAPRPRPVSEPSPAVLAESSTPLPDNGLEADPGAYAQYTAIRVLILGEKVADLAREQSERPRATARDAAPPPPVPTPPPAQPAPARPDIEITITVEHEETRLAVAAAGSSGEAGWSGTASVMHDEVRIEVRQRPVRTADPIVLDLDGDGVELTRLQDGARYDLTGDGTVEQAATVAGGDGFLVLDRDGDGRIASGRELFGDQNGAANGFEELAKLDANADRVVDARDEAFGRLRVWRDLDRDGRADAAELSSLGELGIETLSLDYVDSAEAVAGQRLAQVAVYRTTGGAERRMADAELSYLA